MARGVHLEPLFQKLVPVGTEDSFLLRVDVVRNVNMPAEIFAYRVLPFAVGDTEPVAVFSHVCSRVDLAEFPAYAPTPGAQPPWFRLASFQLEFRGTIRANQAWLDIQAQVRTLVASLDAADQLIPGATVWIGDTASSHV